MCKTLSSKRWTTSLKLMEGGWTTKASRICPTWRRASRRPWGSSHPSQGTTGCAQKTGTTKDSSFRKVLQALNQWQPSNVNLLRDADQHPPLCHSPQPGVLAGARAFQAWKVFIFHFIILVNHCAMCSGSSKRMQTRLFPTHGFPLALALVPASVSHLPSYPLSFTLDYRLGLWGL